MAGWLQVVISIHICRNGGTFSCCTFVIVPVVKLFGAIISIRACFSAKQRRPVTCAVRHFRTGCHYGVTQSIALNAPLFKTWPKRNSTRQHRLVLLTKMLQFILISGQKEIKEPHFIMRLCDSPCTTSTDLSINRVLSRGQPMPSVSQVACYKKYWR